jgi:DNA-binding response OmpR family regulator
MKRAKVLIADDSDQLLTALRLHLLPYGFDVLTCSDAYMALAHARKFRPDVLLLDIQMPAGDGFSVLERMQKLPELCDLPVIYITGNQNAELDLRAEHMGAKGLIHKPISFPVLLRLLDAVLSKSGIPAERTVEPGPLWNIPDPPDGVPSTGRPSYAD